MKAALTTIIAASFLSANAIADSFESQHRVGIGYSTTDVSHPLIDTSGDWGNGIKLEYGYEFNRIVGINASYGKNKETGSYESLSAKVNGTTFKLDTDIGYKFLLDGYSIKPYGAIGLARHSEKLDLYYGESGGTISDDSDTNVFIGLGIRAEVGSNVYTDLRFDYTYFELEGGDLDYDQFSWTIGYKF